MGEVKAELSFRTNASEAILPDDSSDVLQSCLYLTPKSRLIKAEHNNSSTTIRGNSANHTCDAGEQELMAVSQIWPSSAM